MWANPCGAKHKGILKPHKHISEFLFFFSRLLFIPLDFVHAHTHKHTYTRHTICEFVSISILFDVCTGIHKFWIDTWPKQMHIHPHVCATMAEPREQLPNTAHMKAKQFLIFIFYFVTVAHTHSMDMFTLNSRFIYRVRRLLLIFKNFVKCHSLRLKCVNFILIKKQ